jgi:hypothetical protein
MTLRLGAQGLVLTPSRLRVPLKGCVTLSNQTFVSAEFRIAPDYDRTVGAFSATGTSGEPGNYRARLAGRHAVTASSMLGTASGRIDVSAPSPSPSPSATHRPPSPTAAASASPATTTPSGTPAPVPTPTRSVAPSPPPAPVPTASRSRLAVGPPPTLPPRPGPRARALLQPPSDRAIGLPAALAALAVAGVATALLRVLLAEPSPGVRRGPVHSR